MRIKTSNVLLIALAITIVVIGVHWPCVRNGFVRWDDQLYLQHLTNQQGLSWTSVKWSFTALELGGYYALAWLSQLLDYQLFGMNPVGHHAHSVALHAINSGLVFWAIWLLAARLPAQFTDRERLALATLVSFVFALHPLQVESVAWMAERRTVLFGTFAVATVIAYLNHTDRPNATGWWWATIVFTAAAMATKPSAVSLPVVLLIMDWYPLRRVQQAGWWPLVKEKFPLIVMVAALCLATMIAQLNLGSVMALEQLGLVQRGYVAVRGTVFYLWKVFWPAWVSPYYPMEGQIVFGQTDVWVSVLTWVALTVVAVMLRRRWPAVLATWGSFLVLLLPMSGLVQAGGQAAADRYMYLTMLPVVVLMFGVLVCLGRRLSTIGRVSLGLLGGCYLLFLGFTTRAQIPVWKNDFTLWRAAWERYPQSGFLNTELSKTLMRQHDLKGALDFAQEAVAINPNVADSHTQLGTVYLLLKNYPQAVHELITALQLNPSDMYADYNLACVYSHTGRFAEAFAVLERLYRQHKELRQGIREDPELADLRRNPTYGPRLNALQRE